MKNNGKLYNDTYCNLDGAKVFINADTIIETTDEIAKKQILKIVAEEKSDKAVEKVTFLPIDDNALKLAKDEFGVESLEVEDSYVISVEAHKITIYTNSANAVKYAACALIRHYENGVNCGLICNIPVCPVRGVKGYIPARENIEFFKEFAEYCIYYGFNTFYMEVGGAMEYKRHPEINEGWVEYCDFMKEETDRGKMVQLSQKWNKDSIHWENCGGYWLTQDEIKELIEHYNNYGLTVIPEVPCLSHCDYMMTRHPEIAENPEDPFPDCYCPSNPKSYELLYDILDEVVEVFNPLYVHIAHDELYTFCLCEKCSKRDPAELFAEDIQKIHDYLEAKGVGSMIWGDKLLDARQPDKMSFAGGAAYCVTRIPTDKTVEIKGVKYPIHDEDWSYKALTNTGDDITQWYIKPTWPSAKLMPKDLKVMHWYYMFYLPDGNRTDKTFHDNNLWTVYGNFTIKIVDWFKRIAAGIKGFCLSNWSLFEHKYMQRNLIFFNMAYTSMMVWNREFDETKMDENAYLAAHDLFAFAHRDTLKKSHIEITHTTFVKKPHPQFVDGRVMDEDYDRLGYYNIYYADGTVEKKDIFWGINIGYGADVDLTPKFDPATGTQWPVFVFEPCCTCDMERIDGNRYFRTVFPTDKEVVKVEAEIFDEYKADTIVKEIKIVK